MDFSDIVEECSILSQKKPVFRHYIVYISVLAILGEYTPYGLLFCSFFTFVKQLIPILAEVVFLCFLEERSAVTPFQQSILQTSCFLPYHGTQSS